MKKIRPLLISVLILAIGYAAVMLYRNSIAMRPPAAYGLGLVTWVGYAPFYIADEKGFFKDCGINVDLKTMDTPGEREAAYLAGAIDFLPNTPDAFAIFFSTQKPNGSFIAALDESSGADGLVAKKAISSIGDLKGKTVGFQKGITSHFLLLHVLNKAGVSPDSIRQENLSAGDAGAAFMAGKLDAAVTWEPWLSKAKQSTDSHVLITTKDTPGLVVDVLLASPRSLENEAAGASAIMKAWFKALDYMSSNKTEANAILAKRLGVSEAEVLEMLTTTQFYTNERSKEYLKSNFNSIASEAAALYKTSGIITSETNLSERVSIPSAK